MSVDALKDAIPDYAKDLRLNLTNVLATPGMTPSQVWGCALASAIAGRNAFVIQNIAAEAAKHLEPKIQDAAKTAAAIMGMNNIYYRFLHLVSNPEYGTMRANLRMQGMQSHGADPVDFELWSLAVSAINGCGKCLDAHEHELIKKGASKELIQNAVRIAAVLAAISATLDGAAALSS